jgi:putative transposase
MTFVRNHANAVLACAFFVTVTTKFQTLYVLVTMEIGCRRIAHFNPTEHPTLEWALQQFREANQENQTRRFLIHDRDTIYSADLDQAVKTMSLKLLKTPVRALTANAYCERLTGTLSQESAWIS